MAIRVKAPAFEVNRATLYTEDGDLATVWANGDLEIEIRRDGETVVETFHTSRAHFFDLPTRPRDFSVFLDGQHRGHLHRAWSYSFRHDVLTLDGQDHPFPGSSFGICARRDFVSGRPRVDLYRPDRLRLGMFAAAWMWVKQVYV
ncbi:MAG: hypothetical protein V5A84_03010 [Planctomycetota bacterium]